MKNHSNKKKIPVGIFGATGTVGQRFIPLLYNHPWFDVVCVAASPRSAGKTYADAVKTRWTQEIDIPKGIGKLRVLDVVKDISAIKDRITFAFSALTLSKDLIREIEISYAEAGIPVVSNNSAHRWTKDIPMIIPEINPEHLKIVSIQKKNRGWKDGFIVVKPNCSVQSYVPVLKALEAFEPQKIMVTTCQAVSGAGRSLKTWPEIQDNVIPYIPNEDEKSETEPLKILGKIRNEQFILLEKLKISVSCVRIPVSDGHLASVNIEFKTKPNRKEFIDAIENFKNPIAHMNLPSSPKQFLKFFDEEDRPQTARDRNLGNGMTISIGRLREDPIFHWKFIALSHNTLRGAAGGGVLTAELLKKEKYFTNLNR